MLPWPLRALGRDLDPDTLAMLRKIEAQARACKATLVKALADAARESGLSF